MTTPYPMTGTKSKVMECYAKVNNRIVVPSKVSQMLYSILACLPHLKHEFFV